MKQALLFLTTALLISCVNNEDLPDSSSIDIVDAIQFKQLVEAGRGIILDVRTPEEVSQGYIHNASTIDFYDKDFVVKINLIPKDKEIYIYCKYGVRSLEAAEILQKNGFNTVYHLENGLIAWEENGFPLSRTQIAKDDKIQEISLADFQAVLKTDKPVLIDFHTVWCAPCRKMAPIVDKIEEQYTDRAIVMRVDVDKSKDVGKAYEVSGVPVFILFKDGQEIWKHNGIIPEDELKEQIENSLASNSNYHQ